MRTNETVKAFKKHDPSIRTLKIKRSTRYTVARYVDVPEIKLCGTWLEQLGFQCHKHVDVTFLNGVLSIKQRE